MAGGRTLCRLDEIPDPGSRGFELDDGEIFVVRRHGRISAFRNRCPHTGASLNWLPDQFLTVDEDLIQCAIHGAQFRIADGFCVWGPCRGQWLTSVPIAVQDRDIVLLTD